MPFIRLAILLLAVILAGGCQPAGPDDQPPAKIYRHAIDGAPTSLDPAHADNVYAATLVSNLFDTLYRYKYLERPYQLTPNLARDLPEISDDGLTYRIHLRTDVRFIDDPAFPQGQGRAVIAEDVVYSLKRHFLAATRSRGGWLWRDRIVGLDAKQTLSSTDQPVPGLRTEGRHTVVIELIRPYPQFTHTLATALAAIVPREAVEHYGEAFGTHPVGSGPFKLERFDESMAALQPNPHFDRGTIDLAAEGYDPEHHAAYDLEAIDGRDYPLLDRLEIHFITEPTTRWSSFRSSRGVDLVMVPPEMAERVLESRNPPQFRPDLRKRYYSSATPEAGFVFYGFNLGNPAIGYHSDPERQRRNRELRCAMREAFDWSARNETFYHGLGETFPGVIPPLLAAHDPAARRHSLAHHPKRAHKRLQSSGWQDEALPELVYGLESSVQQRQMFEQFRAWMQAVGIPGDHFRPRSFASFGEYARAIGGSQLDLFLMGWTLAYPDAQYALQLFYGPNAAPGANSSNYNNPEYDRLFEKAATLPAGDERQALYRRMNRMVIDDCVIIGSLSRTRLHLWKRHVRMLPDREILGGYFLRFVDVNVDADVNH